jgi:hypothetical protein
LSLILIDSSTYLEIGLVIDYRPQTRLPVSKRQIDYSFYYRLILELAETLVCRCRRPLQERMRQSAHYGVYGGAHFVRVRSQEMTLQLGQRLNAISVAVKIDQRQDRMDECPEPLAMRPGEIDPNHLDLNLGKIF